VINVHLKDGRRTADGWHLLLLGEGEIPVKDALTAIACARLRRLHLVEWERSGTPEIAEPEVAFPQHLALLQDYVRDFGDDNIRRRRRASLACRHSGLSAHTS